MADTEQPTATAEPRASTSKVSDSAPRRSVNPHWDRELIISLATASLTEQRRARRWGVFFKALAFLYIFALVAMFSGYEFSGETLDSGRHTAVIDIDGVIGPGEDASAENVIAGLQAAYEDEDTAGVILRINSPGGSPVQAGMIYDEIQRLRQTHAAIPVFAVITDVCASGGYYVAVAADKIFADKASIVGSIGVRIDGFGFVDAMDKLGVERRLMTAGTNKGLLDPFSPRNPSEVRHIQTLLDDIHGQFIDAVRQGRGDRLAKDPALFSGLIWTGQESVGKGLVDGLASADYVARELIGVKEKLNFTPRSGALERLAERFGAAIGHEVATRLGGLELR